MYSIEKNHLSHPFSHYKDELSQSIFPLATKNMDDKNSSTKEKEKQDTVLTSSESQMYVSVLWTLLEFGKIFLFNDVTTLFLFSRSENQTNNSNGNMNNESDSSTTDNNTNDPGNISISYHLVVFLLQSAFHTIPWLWRLV